MVIFILVHIRMVNLMVKVNIIGQMVQLILVILYKVKDKDLVNGDLIK